MLVAPAAGVRCDERLGLMITEPLHLYTGKTDWSPVCNQMSKRVTSQAQGSRNIDLGIDAVMIHWPLKREPQKGIQPGNH